MLRNFILFSVLSALAMSGVQAQEEEPQKFVGNLTQEAADDSGPLPVRNDVAQPGEEIVTLRYFKIRKGEFPRFVEASRNGVWPYFEKIGARVVGMWQVVHPEEAETTGGSADYDEVYLMTRYASAAHWKATRDTVVHGGNGPDWDACLAAIRLRRSLTYETHLTFLQGLKWDNTPWFLPGLHEQYAPADKKEE